MLGTSRSADHSDPDAGARLNDDRLADDRLDDDRLDDDRLAGDALIAGLGAMIVP
jgi:hypothetical protein